MGCPWGLGRSRSPGAFSLGSSSLRPSPLLPSALCLPAWLQRAEGNDGKLVT